MDRRSSLLGSIPVGYLLLQIFKRQDIRTVGSGNIGARTCCVRQQGLEAATCTRHSKALCGAVGTLIAAPVC
jgi:glycerol-3-phosphate acyltransferase PlsY